MELPKPVGEPDHRVAFERSSKRMRVIVEETTIDDTVGPSPFRSMTSRLPSPWSWCVPLHRSVT